MILVDVRIHLEHAQVIRSKIGPESVEKCRDVQNEPIWANFRKKAKGVHLDPFFKTPLYFLEAENSIIRALYIYYIFNRLENIQIKFFNIFINIKYSNYDRISKSRRKYNILLSVSLWIYKNKKYFFLY
jgi:hypothetical protein